MFLGWLMMELLVMANSRDVVWEISSQWGPS